MKYFLTLAGAACLITTQTFNLLGTRLSMTIDRLIKITAATLTLLGCSLSCLSQDFPNSMLSWHNAVFDSEHKLVSWYQPETGLAFDHVMHLGWDYIEHKIP